ncbi:MAG: hypothetical protein AAGJ37_02610 [Pseudomonadota bacterium]
MEDLITHDLDDSYCSVTGKMIAKRPSLKIELTGLALLRAGSKGVNQPELHNLYGESCCHTSMSILQNKHGISISRRSEPWKHRHGGTTHFNRYWLADDFAELKMVSLLNSLRTKRGMANIIVGEYFKLPNKPF